MNSTEAAYAMHLRLLHGAGEILWWRWAPGSLRLTDRTDGKSIHYRPDFLVVSKDRTLEIHEVKGHWTDDAKVKLSIAADQFPFKFIAVYKDGRGWRYEDFSVRSKDDDEESVHRKR